MQKRLSILAPSVLASSASGGREGGAQAAFLRSSSFLILPDSRNSSIIEAEDLPMSFSLRACLPEFGNTFGPREDAGPRAGTARPRDREEVLVTPALFAGGDGFGLRDELRGDLLEGDALHRVARLRASHVGRRKE